MEKFAIGLLMGGVIGAVLVSNNYKVRTLVKKGQKEMQEKIDAMMDKTMDAMDEEKQPTKAEKTEKSKKSRVKKPAPAEA